MGRMLGDAGASSIRAGAAIPYGELRQARTGLARGLELLERGVLEHEPPLGAVRGEPDDRDPAGLEAE